MGAIADLEVVVAAVSSVAQVTIAIGAIGLIAGAFYAITHVTGARITDAREDMHREIDTFRTTSTRASRS